MPDLTLLQPLRLPDAVPAEIPPRPRLEWLPVRSLRVDHSYQRHLSERSARLVRRIVEHFDWRHIKALNVVALDDGTYEVLDGQHTAVAAITHGAVEDLPCLVFPRGDIAAHARAFVGLNRDRLRVTSLQTFWASVVSGDEIALRVMTAAERAKVRILRAPPPNGRYQPGDTVAVVTLCKAAQAKGVAGCARLLSIGREAQLAPIRADHLEALRRLLWSPEYKGEIPDRRLALTLRSELDDITAAAIAHRSMHGGTLVAALAVALYRKAS